MAFGYSHHHQPWNSSSHHGWLCCRYYNGYGWWWSQAQDGIFLLDWVAWPYQLDWYMYWNGSICCNTYKPNFQSWLDHWWHWFHNSLKSWLSSAASPTKLSTPARPSAWVGWLLYLSTVDCFQNTHHFTWIEINGVQAEFRVGDILLPSCCRN